MSFGDHFNIKIMLKIINTRSKITIFVPEWQKSNFIRNKPRSYYFQRETNKKIQQFECTHAKYSKKEKSGKLRM